MKVPRGTTPTGIRFIPEIKAFYIEQAKKNGRSLNSEIMQVLKEAMSVQVENRKEKQSSVEMETP